MSPNEETHSEEVVDRAVAALVADWERQEGALRRSQVERLILKRRLSLDEGASVFRGLAIRGIVLESASDAISVPSQASASSEEGYHGGSEDFVPAYFSRRLLSQREEIELGRAIQLGLLARADLESGSDSVDLHEFVAEGERARARLVESNLRLVLSVARKLLGVESNELPDIVQEGTLGLMRAAELFDPDLGLKFSTYATHWIRQAIFRGLDNFAGTIRLPVHRLESIRKFRRVRRVLLHELGRQPKLPEIAEALDWEPEKVAYIQVLAQMRVFPLDTPVDSESSLTLGDILESPAPNPEQQYIQADFKRVVREALDSLKPRQRLILLRRFGLVDGREETLQQIADDLNVTRERIRQIEVRALKCILPRAQSIQAAQPI